MGKIADIIEYDHSYAYRVRVPGNRNQFLEMPDEIEVIEARPFSVGDEVWVRGKVREVGSNWVHVIPNGLEGSFGVSLDSVKHAEES